MPVDEIDTAQLRAVLASTAGEADPKFDVRRDPEENTEPSGSAACHTCKINVFKYKCPRCGVKTCSLACSKSHKQNLGCNGKRKRSEFVRISEFGDKQLLTDLNFLEEVERERNLRASPTLPTGTRSLPPRLWELQQQAGRRRVCLQFMHPGMQKRALNELYFDRRAQKLLWFLEWHFVGAGLKFHARRVPETALLQDALQQQLNSSKEVEKLQPYTTASASGLQIVMQHVRCKTGHTKYYRLDKGASLASQLSGKTVIEFPTLLVLLPHEAKDYRSSSDGESSEEESSSEESSDGEEEETAA